eukprot:6195685-Pleurochrysis_carterae.AAC.1
MKSVESAIISCLRPRLFLGLACTALLFPARTLSNSRFSSASAGRSLAGTARCGSAAILAYARAYAAVVVDSTADVVAGDGARARARARANIGADAGASREAHHYFYRYVYQYQCGADQGVERHPAAADCEDGRLVLQAFAPIRTAEVQQQLSGLLQSDSSCAQTCVGAGLPIPETSADVSDAPDRQDQAESTPSATSATMPGSPEPRSRAGSAACERETPEKMLVADAHRLSSRHISKQSRLASQCSSLLQAQFQERVSDEIHVGCDADGKGARGRDCGDVGQSGTSNTNGLIEVCSEITRDVLSLSPPAASSTSRTAAAFAPSAAAVESVAAEMLIAAAMPATKAVARTRDVATANTAHEPCPPAPSFASAPTSTVSDALLPNAHAVKSASSLCAPVQVGSEAFEPMDTSMAGTSQSLKEVKA